jgi:hypothetical protein
VRRFSSASRPLSFCIPNPANRDPRQTLHLRLLWVKFSRRGIGGSGSFRNLFRKAASSQAQSGFCPGGRVLVGVQAWGAYGTSFAITRVVP